jgi:hypothetical protein
MTSEWSEKETTTHQDHVIAHVIGATVFGYFIHDEAIYILLDIGFLWRIYVDGEMGLLLHPVAMAELEVGAEKRSEIQSDIELLLREGPGAGPLTQLSNAPAHCVIEDVTLLNKGDKRRLFIKGEEDSFVVETSVSSGEVKVLSDHDIHK